jgi:hypothetical protein
MANRKLVQRPDYRRRYTDELFAQYMSLLESGRTRFLTQLQEWQENVPERYPVQIQSHDGLTQPISVKKFTLGHTKGTKRNERVRVVSAVRLLQMPLSGSTPLAFCWKGVSRNVVHAIDHSGSAGTAGSAIDSVELTVPVTQERVVPLEEFSLGYHHGLVKGGRSGEPLRIFNPQLRRE